MMPGLALLRTMRASAAPRPALAGWGTNYAPRYSLAASGENVSGLRDSGALIQVKLGHPEEAAAQLRKDGKDVPAPIDLLAMIDTGASITAVDRSVAERLGLIQTGEAAISGVTGVQNQPIYAGRVQFESPDVAMDPWRLIGSPIGVQGFQVLIGRDILQQMTLVYDGAQGTFDLAGPGFTKSSPTSTAAKVAGVALATGGVGLAVAMFLKLFKKSR